MGGIRKQVRLIMAAHQSVLFAPSSPFPSLAAASHLRRAAGSMACSPSDATAQQKRAIRSEVRKALKAFSPSQRSHEDSVIQSLVLDSSWFKSCRSLCAYISCEALREVDTSRIISETLNNVDTVSSQDNDAQAKKKLYVPRVEDKNSHMRMFHISRTEDLVANSMNILEPSPTDADGNQREDVMLANHPVDLFLLPGLAFDKTGRRLGRGGGYYDVLLKKYHDLAMEQSWAQPLLVALAYSVQIMEENVIPITPNDIPVDALVTASGVIPITPAALERM
ncbi:5-formyltetrahydrofolate cyclo-ligase protein [Dioscorea alata]|uniref:5-formyltetrahydrofolate cyclo-ligase protein n=1 Tax=Dioscorea alata TaxID=55571 RepID=A0ACB7UMY6_DIOAL|nr:5-formyltetrahydrofolate cyclo-ligase protein [Dioscorea alata]